MRYKRKQRLKKTSDFQEIKEKGTRIDGGPFLFCIREIQDGSADELRRLGLIVSKKVGNAVVRNRIKRIMREIFRKNLQELPHRCDLVIVAKRHVTEYGQDSLKERFKDCCKRYFKGKRTTE